MILQADARHIPLADESVQCVITSPPYWGLRDYKLKPGVWGGEVGCDHGWVEETVSAKMRRGLGLADSPASTRGGGKKVATIPDFEFRRGFCSSCGAWRGSLGLEPTPELYVQHIVEIFREVRRVLRKDGTLWLNLGDSYAGYHGNSRVPDRDAPSNKPGYIENMRGTTVGINGLKPKDLVGIPWRVAFALQADGWWLRSDIIWAKKNCMPESVTDRPTKSHEYIFLLAKSERYYWDQDEVREPYLWPDGPNAPDAIKSPYGQGFTRAALSHKGSKFKEGKTSIHQHERASDNERQDHTGRNIRSVWHIATQPFPEAHFATFPEKLVEPCVKAGSREGDIVLDPFGGSGTVGVVCGKLGRRFVGLDLSHEYCQMAVKRIGPQAVLPLRT